MLKFKRKFRRLKVTEDSRVLYLEHSFYGAETWTLRNVDQKYLEYFGMWFWRTLEKISWIDPVRNGLRRVKERTDSKKEGRLTGLVSHLA